MAFKIAFFDTKPYDRASFDEVNEKYGFEILYHKGQLNRNNVVLTQGMDAICIFVHDTADTAIIEQMAGYGVKLIALRAAGYNNVDLAAAKDKLKVVRVPLSPQTTLTIKVLHARHPKRNPFLRPFWVLSFYLR